MIYYNFCFDDSEFGTVYIRHNSRARNIIFRVINSHVVITTPLGFNIANTRPYFEQRRGNIRQLWQKSQSQNQHLIDADFHILTDIFEFSIICNQQSGFRLHKQPTYSSDSNTIDTLTHYHVELQCPTDYDFSQQEWLQKVIVNAITQFAKSYLYFYLKQMSALSGLEFEDISVGHAQTRWGACRRLSNVPKTLTPHKRNDMCMVDIGNWTKEEFFQHKINLSAYTALLPSDLRNFILLHELTHTRHPDHSERFHNTLNLLCTKILGNSEAVFNQRLKTFHTNIFCFAK